MVSTVRSVHDLDQAIFPKAVDYLLAGAPLFYVAEIPGVIGLPKTYCWQPGMNSIYGEHSRINGCPVSLDNYTIPPMFHAHSPGSRLEQIAQQMQQNGIFHCPAPAPNLVSISFSTRMEHNKND